VDRDQELPGSRRRRERAGRAGVNARRVVLRAEHAGADSRFLEAYVDADGALHIDGQDLGPGTRPVSSDGEYEWFATIAAEDVPRLEVLLGAAADEDVLDVLARSYTGRASYELERLLRESDIPVRRSVWSG
jgi:hypothetical protein